MGSDGQEPLRWLHTNEVGSYLQRLDEIFAEDCEGVEDQAARAGLSPVRAVLDLTPAWATLLSAPPTTAEVRLFYDTCCRSCPRCLFVSTRGLRM